MAKQLGVKIVISTDSHRTANLALMKYGVLTARRGWLEKKDVINTLPVEKFLDALRAKPHGSAMTQHAAASGDSGAPARRRKPSK